MTSDVKIPEWATEEAGKIADVWQHPMHHDHQILSQDIALALLAAEQRGRKAGLEEAAKVACADDGKAPGGFGNPDFGPNVARRIAAAIRSLGEKL